MNKPLSAAEASAGHNKPALLTPDMMARDFAYLETALAEIEKHVKSCPPVVEDDEDIEKVRDVVKRCAGAFKRLEAVRVEAKEPYLSASRIVDGHLNALKCKVAGWQDMLGARVKRLLDKRLVDERALRDEEARQAAEDARLAAEAARAAEHDRVKAEQTNLAEILAGDSPSIGDTDGGMIETARIEETTLRTDAIRKSVTALKAQEAAAAKPADIVRVRGGTGISTLAEVWLSEIEDLEAVDLNALREHIPLADIEKAVRRFVSVHKGDRSLKGVRIYRDTKILMT